MVSQWTLDGLARFMKRQLEPDELDTLLNVELALFVRLRDALAAKRIWVWNETGPRAPLVLRESVRFSFHPTIWAPDRLTGFVSPDIFATFEDGPDVVDDIHDEILRILPIGEAIDAGPMSVTFTNVESWGGQVKFGKSLYLPTVASFVATPASPSTEPV